MPEDSLQDASSPRYSARGVSAEKHDVHQVVNRLDPGLFPGSFCKVIPTHWAAVSNIATSSMRTVAAPSPSLPIFTTVNSAIPEYLRGSVKIPLL